MSGRAPKDKGNRFERAIVRLLQDQGLGAERVPLSGSCGGRYAGDLTVPVNGRDLTVEAKARANGFATLYTWLDGRDALIIRADRKEPLVVIPMRLAIEIAMAAEKRKIKTIAPATIADKVSIAIDAVMSAALLANEYSREAALDEARDIIADLFRA